MAAVTVLNRSRPAPNMEAVRFTIAADADTYSPLLARVEQVIMGCPERDNAAADSWGYTIDSARRVITIQAIGTTAFDVCLLLIGNP